MNEQTLELDFSAPSVTAAPSAALAAALAPAGSAELQRLVDYLGTHCVGRDRAKPARDIAADLGYVGAYRDRVVRNLINLNYRSLPFVVCGLGDGFFVATDPEDVAHKHRDLYARLKAIAVLLSDFKFTARRSGFTQTGAGGSVVYASRV